MATSFEYDVFLSYSSKDRDAVLDLANRLQRDGLRVWIDTRAIEVGDPILSKIDEGQEHSRVLVICMSANYFSAEWGTYEQGTFRFRDPQNKERRFIPVRLDDATIPDSLKQYLFVDWRNKSDLEYQKLLAACRPAPRGRDAELLEACRRQTHRALAHYAKPDRKIVTDCYVERKLDMVFDRFLEDTTASCLVIVDEPGTGKTSLLAHQALKAVEERGVPAIFLSTDEYLATGLLCTDFEAFVLRSIQPHLSATWVCPRGDLTTVDDLLCTCQPKPGLPKLLVVLDALNEIHAAGQAAQEGHRTQAVDSSQLLSFIKKHSPTDVKLLVSSRKVTWKELYEKDCEEWKKYTWRPEWADLYATFFLGGLRPKEFVGATTATEHGEDSRHTSGRIVELTLGAFDDLELCLALGRYQTKRHVRVVPGESAFEELKDPFFLGLCFFVWGEERARQAVKWLHKEPKDVDRREGDRWLIPLNALEWFDLSASFWNESVRRLVESLTPTESKVDENASQQLRDKVEQFTDRMVRQMWDTGSDRTPSAKLATLREDALGEKVYKAMLRYEMIVREGPEDQELVKFSRDRIAAFHIVRTLRDRLRHAHRFAEPVGEFLRFVETSEKHDLFAGLTPHVLRLCGQFAPALPQKLLRNLIWRSSGQPGWFVEASVCLAQFDSSQQLEIVSELLSRFLTWLLPAESVGSSEPLLNYESASALLDRLAAGSVDHSDQLARFQALEAGSNVRITRPAIQALSRLGDICPSTLPEDDPRRQLARGMVQAALHAFRQHAHIREGEERSDAGWHSLSPEHEAHNLANDLYKAGLFQDAVSFYRVALELNPGLLETHFNLGLALTRLCDYVSAECSLNRVIEMNDHLAEAYYTRGLIREYQSNFEGALTDYQKALEIDPGYTKAIEQIDLVKAKTSGETSGELRMRSPAWTLFAEAMNLTKQGDVESARKRLQSARDLGLELDVSDLQDLASSLWMNGFVSLAVENYLSLLSLAAILTRQELADLLLAIGSTHGDRNDFGRSLEFTLAATAANPDLAVAFNNLSSHFAYSELPWSCPEAAIREAETAIRLDKTLTGSLISEAEAYRLLGNISMTIDCLKAAASRGDFHSASAWAALAWHYSTDVPAAERHRRLEKAGHLFHSEQEKARSCYVLESIIEWWYAGARVMAQLGWPEYREFRAKAQEMLHRAKEITPYAPDLLCRIPRDLFFNRLDDLDQEYRAARQ
jgi:tetratricopeptide (TPR) repeat protein